MTISHDHMKALCPGLTAKTELVLVTNPVTGDEAMYARDGKDWYLLDGGAAPTTPSPGAAPLSGENGPEKGPAEGDDVLAGPSGPVGSLPGGLAGSNG